MTKHPYNPSGLPDHPVYSQSRPIVRPPSRMPRRASLCGTRGPRTTTSDSSRGSESPSHRESELDRNRCMCITLMVVVNSMGVCVCLLYALEELM